MKTVQMIESRIMQIAAEMQRVIDARKRAKLTGKIEFLKEMKLFLLTGPSKERLESQLQELKTKIRILEGRFQTWKVGRVGSDDDLRPKFRREVGISALQTQIRTLEFLLIDERDE